MDEIKTVVLSKPMFDKILNVVANMPYAQVAQLIEEVKQDLQKNMTESPQDPTKYDMDSSTEKDQEDRPVYDNSAELAQKKI